MSTRDAEVGRSGRILRWIERVGNGLPHPATLFLCLAVLVVVASELAVRSGVEVARPGTGEIVRPVSLMTIDGLHRILTSLVTNFTGFAPLGTVLVALLGIGIAESSGFIGTSMRLFVLKAPRNLLTLVVVFAGVMSNTASEIGYVLLVPLAALIFAAAGRHPIAGLAAAFAGVSGGYSANLFLGTIDPLLAGLTQEAARILEPGRLVNPACNYYFMAVSTFLITGVGWLITDRFVEPKLPPWKDSGGDDSALRPLSAEERRGLLYAGVAGAVFTALIVWGTVPSDGYLRDPKTGDLLHSPFLSGIVALIFAAGALLGIAYGVGARTIRSDAAVMKGMAKSMETLASYLVLVFFAAQFVAFFNWTNLGLVVAVKGASVLQASGLSGVPLMIGFILLTAFLNLFMGSASAKWAIMAPIFVPMFQILGYAPELTQAAYRVGDSCTNIVSPMMSYFALIIAFFQRYQKEAGIGTLIATMLPYSIAFLITWSALLGAWMAFGLPLGPGAS
ncbi:MAG: AbgT family transporter [Planctomycetota bacterium]|nr:AbgT family transporter [Planctomycetota bacterium]